MLAGDHLKTASDLGVPMVGVGLLYRSGYYRQRIEPDGRTGVVYPHYDFERLPIERTDRRVAVPLGRRRVWAQIWRVQVGRVPLLLLDTDVPDNPPALRSITDRLYGGDPLHRLRQQVVLGVGGVRALRAMKLPVSVYHLNEGHAAFCSLERLRELAESGVSLEQAIERVRETTVFTTHTPVPAGHDRYDPKMIVRELGPLAKKAGLWPARDGKPQPDLLSLGRENPDDAAEPLCMTVLAIRLAGRVNGVSALHGEVTRRMWAGLYQRHGEELAEIGHVTNGVHTATWLDPLAAELYRRFLRIDPLSLGPDDARWQQIDRVPDEALWALRCQLRRRLVAYVRQQVARQQVRPGFERLPEAEALLRDDALTIGFARRFATYKRAVLLFRDVRRLERIVNDPKRPVQIIFAGKAHPADREGQRFLQRVWRLSQRPALRGRVVVLEDYDMHMGRMLTRGCDVWLNTPRRPMEASGTSGMKPALHGALNVSISDGWWAEGYDGRNGWMIGDGRELRSDAAQDRYDAEALYGLLEREVVPLFYRRDGGGVPRAWVARMKAAIRTIAGRFGSQRMLAEYVEKYYL